ncbi:cell division protein FtsQ/DivIB [Zoogloea sp.]|uniref:cell division protein FtsQ/DivIB n=1 Tax=Zoogloea sp. TaxID=49181 RepID=UPI0026122D0F|nr:cell division protein FtsQ/DivIB [Zoogloea sp.]MDD3353106.1 cell division protein FtsQ/DivIB [Zoogloea sp.]
MADLRSTSNVPPEPGAKRVRGKRATPSRVARDGGGNGLWDRPQLLDVISDTLMVAGALGLGYAAVAAISHMPAFPLREVVVTTPLAQVTSAQLEYAARSSVRGNFFTVDLQDVRGAFEKLPWVRRADVRRRWPVGLEVRLEEHVASAYWRVGETGDMRLVNRFGEVFTAASNAKMPIFSGPEGSSGILLAKFDDFSRKLGPLGRQLVGVSLSAREAWQLKMEDGLTIELGHDQPKAPIDERLARFVRYYPKAKAQLNMNVAVVDLRYPSGFALRPIPSAQPVGKKDSKGK